MIIPFFGEKLAKWHMPYIGYWKMKRSMQEYLSLVLRNFINGGIVV